MSDHELASEAHKTTFSGMMSNSRILSLFCGFVLLLLAALFGVPVPLLALTAIILVVAFVFMGGAASTGIIALVLFAAFGMVWYFGSWFIGLF